MADDTAISERFEGRSATPEADTRPAGANAEASVAEFEAAAVTAPGEAGAAAGEAVDAADVEDGAAQDRAAEDGTAASAERPGRSGGLEDGSPDAMTHPLVQDLLLQPHRWRLWPAVAVLRWLQRRLQTGSRRLAYRSQPSLAFAPSEVNDVVFREQGLDIVLNAPGLAATGSALPTSDIARVVADHRAHGAMSVWLDGPGDRFMHLVEEMKMQCDPAYALLTGGRVEAFDLVADLVGRSAPLAAEPGGELLDDPARAPDGGLGLAGLFVGPISAAGLAAAVQAFCGLPARVDEFTGATVVTARPARLGGPLGLMLGARCRLPSAGVEVHIEGGSRRVARDWAADAVRRRSLHALASAYVGASLPVARVYMWLDADNAPPAVLDGGAALGGLAVLGRAAGPVRLPLAAGPRGAAAEQAHRAPPGVANGEPTGG